MMNHSMKHLQAKNTQRTLEAIMIFLAALFTTAFLPSLLLRYVYTNTEAFVQPPAVFEYIPVVSYLIAMAYFIFALVGNLIRDRKLAGMVQEMDSSTCNCGGSCNCGPHCNCGHHGDEMLTEEELAELESMVTQAMDKKAPTKSSAKKSKGKSSAKKKQSSSKKTTSSKKSK